MKYRSNFCSPEAARLLYQIAARVTSAARYPTSKTAEGMQDHLAHLHLRQLDFPCSSGMSSSLMRVSAKPKCSKKPYPQNCRGRPGPPRASPGHLPRSGPPAGLRGDAERTPAGPTAGAARPARRCLQAWLPPRYHPGSCTRAGLATGRPTSQIQDNLARLSAACLRQAFRRLRSRQRGLPSLYEVYW